MAAARVTLVHGFLGSPADWADVLANLAAGIACDCVALADLGCASVDEASAQLAARLERSPCDLLVGYSLGGRIALELAASRPELVPRLALFAAGMGIEDANERAVRASEDDRRAEDLRVHGLERASTGGQRRILGALRFRLVGGPYPSALGRAPRARVAHRAGRGRTRRAICCRVRTGSAYCARTSCRDCFRFGPRASA